MVERGTRYIISTASDIFLTPAVRLENSKLLFAKPDLNGSYESVELPVDSVVSVFKEDFEKTDVTEEFISSNSRDTLVLSF